MVSSFAAIPAGAQAKPVPGKLAGVVRDAAGTPQMGASVELVSEAVGVAASHGLLTNTQGMFRGEKLAPGVYTDRKSTRLNSSHSQISYAVFCLKKKKDIHN